MWSPDPDEDRPALTALGATVEQPGCHRFTDVGGKGQTLDTVALAAHDDLTCPPIDVVEFECGDLAGAQSETREGGQEGEITSTYVCAAVTGRQELPYLGRLEFFRQFSQSSLCH